MKKLVEIVNTITRRRLENFCYVMRNTKYQALHMLQGNIKGTHTCLRQKTSWLWLGNETTTFRKVVLQIDNIL